MQVFNGPVTTGEATGKSSHDSAGWPGSGSPGTGSNGRPAPGDPAESYDDLSVDSRVVPGKIRYEVGRGRPCSSCGCKGSRLCLSCGRAPTPAVHSTTANGCQGGGWFEKECLLPFANHSPLNADVSSGSSCSGPSCVLTKTCEAAGAVRSKIRKDGHAQNTASG